MFPGVLVPVYSLFRSVRCRADTGLLASQGSHGMDTPWWASWYPRPLGSQFVFFFSFLWCAKFSEFTWKWGVTLFAGTYQHKHTLSYTHTLSHTHIHTYIHSLTHTYTLCCACKFSRRNADSSVHPSNVLVSENSVKKKGCRNESQQLDPECFCIICSPYSFFYKRIPTIQISPSFSGWWFL